MGAARGVPCMLELLETVDVAALTTGDAYLDQDRNQDRPPEPEPKQPFMATAALRLFEQLDGGGPSTEGGKGKQGREGGEGRQGREGGVAPEAEAKKDA